MQCDYCSWISHILAKIKAETQAIEKKKLTRVDPVVVVHGGAGKIPRDARKFMLKEVKNAAVLAYCELIKGHCSLDAVERAICHMESKKYFNCAYGGSLDANKEVSMDAAMMTDDFCAGCVGAVRNIEHPISLAKKVLQETAHVLIVENGAQKLASESGFLILSPGQLIIAPDSETSQEDNGAEKAQELSRGEQEPSSAKECIAECVIIREEEEDSTIPTVVFTESKESPEIEVDSMQIGAVGAVAYDRKKRLASGTSTAGEPGKLYGSVSATGTAIGCGIYVDQTSSVSVSGSEKAIYSYAPARCIAQRLQKKPTPIGDTVATVLKDFEEKTGTSDVGAIAVTANGSPSVSFRSVHFPWAYCYKGYVYYGCARNERFSEKIDVLERPLDCMCEESD